MKAKQFAWVYLVEYGHAGMTPGYYGGYEIDRKMDPRYKENKKYGYTDYREQFLKEILRVGVDWDKTYEPQSDRFSVFTDTFHDPEMKECLVGRLVLKDGSTQLWSGDSLKVSNVFDMMESMSQATENFVKYFGESA